MDNSNMDYEKLNEERKNKKVKKSSRPLGTIYPQRIKDTIAGESTKLTFGPGVPVKHVKRKVGDKWEDSDGFTIEQMNGYVIKHPKVGNLDVPTFCPECKNLMRKKADEKFWALHGLCLNCVIELEHKIRISGDWDEYQKNKILQNKLSFLKDTLRQSKDHINVTLKKKMEFHTEEGKVEQWDNENYETEKTFIENNIIEIEELIRKMELVIDGKMTEEEAFAESVEKTTENNDG